MHNWCGTRQRTTTSLESDESEWDRSDRHDSCRDSRAAAREHITRSFVAAHRTPAFGFKACLMCASQCAHADVVQAPQRLARLRPASAFRIHFGTCLGARARAATTPLLPWHLQILHCMACQRACTRWRLSPSRGSERATQPHARDCGRFQPRWQRRLVAAPPPFITPVACLAHDCHAGTLY